MRFFIILLALVPLYSCSWFTEPVAASATPYGILVAADTVSMIDTRKTISDHIISAYTNRDCSSYRFYQQNKPYCIDRNPPPPEPQEEDPVFCYNSLMGVNCYDNPVYGPGYLK